MIFEFTFLLKVSGKASWQTQMVHLKHFVVTGLRSAFVPESSQLVSLKFCKQAVMGSWCALSQILAEAPPPGS